MWVTEQTNQGPDCIRQKAWRFTLIPSLKQSFFTPSILNAKLFVNFHQLLGRSSSWLVPTSTATRTQSPRHLFAHDPPKVFSMQGGLSGQQNVHLWNSPSLEVHTLSMGRTLSQWGSHQSVTVSEGIADMGSCQHMQYLLLLFPFSLHTDILKWGLGGSRDHSSWPAFSNCSSPEDLPITVRPMQNNLACISSTLPIASTFVFTQLSVQGFSLLLGRASRWRMTLMSFLHITFFLSHGGLSEIYHRLSPCEDSDWHWAPEHFSSIFIYLLEVVGISRTVLAKQGWLRNLWICFAKEKTPCQLWPFAEALPSHSEDNQEVHGFTGNLFAVSVCNHTHSSLQTQEWGGDLTSNPWDASTPCYASWCHVEQSLGAPASTLNQCH